MSKREGRSKIFFNYKDIRKAGGKLAVGRTRGQTRRYRRCRRNGMWTPYGRDLRPTTHSLSPSSSSLSWIRFVCSQHVRARITFESKTLESCCRDYSPRVSTKLPSDSLNVIFETKFFVFKLT